MRSLSGLGSAYFQFLSQVSLLVEIVLPFPLSFSFTLLHSNCSFLWSLPILNTEILLLMSYLFLYGNGKTFFLVLLFVLIHNVLYQILKKFSHGLVFVADCSINRKSTAFWFSSSGTEVRYFVAIPQTIGMIQGQKLVQAQILKYTSFCYCQISFQQAYKDLGQVSPLVSKQCSIIQLLQSWASLSLYLCSYLFNIITTQLLSKQVNPIAEYKWIDRVGIFIYLFYIIGYPEMIRRMSIPSGMKQFFVCPDEDMLVAVTYDVIKIYDAAIGSPKIAIKLENTPLICKLSPNGRYIAVHTTRGVILIYETMSGTLIQHIGNVPSIKNIRFSKRSSKLLFASSSSLCLWNIKQSKFDLYTHNWYNIHSFDINSNDLQLALGTFNGTIYIVNILPNNQISQIQIKKLTSCIVAICFDSNKLVSVSYEGILLFAIFSSLSNSQRSVEYREIKIHDIPREIQIVGQRFYLYSHNGIKWISQNYKIVEVLDTPNCKVLINDRNEHIMVKAEKGELFWWNIQKLKN